MNKPLQHITVLDLSRVLAGPWASQNLADMGARVIKVERPEAGDDTRGWGPPFLKDKQGNDTKESAYYLSANRGKQSITVDITKPEGQKIIRNLAKKSDVVLENFKAGALRKYGLDYESLSKENSKLVYCSITGFGQDGPFRDVAGYDYMIQAAAGLMSITGQPDDHPGGEPMRVGVAVVDIMSGMYSLSAVLAALIQREKIGRGQYIDIALFDVQLAALANQAGNYLISGKAPGRIGNTHPNIVPYQVFRAADEYMIVAVGNDSQFAKFSACIGSPELSVDAKFATNAGRVENRNTLIPILAELMKKKSVHEWVQMFDKEKIPCGPINNIEEAFSHPQAKFRGARINLPHPESGHVDGVQNPIRFGSQSLTSENAPPLLGQHTDSVLHDILNLTDDEIRKLREAKVI